MFSRRGIVLAVAMGVALGMPAHAESGARAVAPGDSSGILISQAAQKVVVPRVFVDPVLRQNWVVLVDRAHPERPPKMVQLLDRTRAVESAPAFAQPVRLANAQQSARPSAIPLPLPRPQATSALRDAAQASAPRPLMVRAGDRVHLWSSSTNVRLEIEAVSLDYGHAGQIIHLRRLGQDATQRVLLTAVVSGRASAELLP
jgi:hypothetical protein